VDGVGQPSDFTGLSRRKWYFMAAGWSLLLLVPAVVALTSDEPLSLRVVQLLAVLGYAACYVFGLYEGVRRGSPVVTVALLVVMAALFVVLAGVGSGLFTVAFLVVAVIMLVPGRWGTVGAVVASVGAVLVVWLLSGALNWGEVIGTAAICVAQIGMFGVIRVNAELRAAQAELAELAVTAERERMARDLHDVLGHSLTTITVKAGLARRLLEAGEQGRAADEVADVERLGRQALSDVRATVAANRVASLPRELAGAAEALRAAGIAADLPHAVDDVPAERQEVFAYVVREGRHQHDPAQRGEPVHGAVDADVGRDRRRRGGQPGGHPVRQRDHRPHGAARGDRRLGRRRSDPVRWLPPAGGVPARAEGGPRVTGVAPRRVSGVTFRTLSVCGVTPLTSGGGRG
jgi:two-component system sensor histidine kinase DesK